ncbi:hypothetical protein TTHERM_00912340 (macronuclear) [Tetrahymena thermophila SB210]|uniref:Uncharacterized protein n=1 Tax=Tetrahymena thermophila (strain SB210) TaxID=312017 RepID=Q23TU1_TETTS|nr:hypothetical protein TTHERM_00912340 [Tetrahymena thermophila SB210]EAR99954.2 hypothetical protein TTHERM_00912340 [Tetrahymena thermophila SB210]|eukprot:XP_001020199.2 hypothetical protein TTHERM_00912340 [Tetrahymena thermophila SB210]
MDIQVKQEYDEHIQTQQNYFLFNFNEKQFNDVKDKEQFYMELYQQIYQQIINYKLKIHFNLPKVNEYQSGMCFVLKRPSNSSLGRIINGMNASKYYNCQKGLVCYIGQLAYLDGYFRYNKTLGIRVVRFASKNQLQLNEDILKYIDFVLIHIFVRDISDENQLKQSAFKDANNCSRKVQSLQNYDYNGYMEKESSDSEEKTFNPRLIKYEKLNNNARQLVKSQSQMYFDGRDIQLKLNDETQIQKKEISQKKGELIELEAKLQKLVEEKEEYIRSPKLLNLYQMLSSEQKIQFS